MKKNTIFKNRAGRRAFSLWEILVVLAIMGMIASVAMPSYLRKLESDQVKVEDGLMEALRTDFIAACESPEPAVNPAVFPGIPGLQPTVWSDAVNYSATNAGDWFAKLALFRGSTPTAAPAGSQPVVAGVVFNHYGQPRLLLAGPSNEPNAQRFLLVSLMERSEKLTLPAPDGSLDYFESLYSAKDWNTRGGTMPAYLASKLTPAQLSAWMPGGAIGGKFFKLRVLAFSIPKHIVTISNSHLEVNAWVTYDFGKSVFPAPANSGVQITPPILGGQVVRIYRGNGDISTAVEDKRVTIRENFDVVIQNRN
jgi:prepilin-type N-terminal cleavage/methylation domain-containing protein